MLKTIQAEYFHKQAVIWGFISRVGFLHPIRNYAIESASNAWRAAIKARIADLGFRFPNADEMPTDVLPPDFDFIDEEIAERILPDMERLISGEVSVRQFKTIYLGYFDMPMPRACATNLMLYLKDVLLDLKHEPENARLVANGLASVIANIRDDALRGHWGVFSGTPLQTMTVWFGHKI